MVKAVADEPESKLEAKPESNADSAPAAKPESKNGSKSDTNDDLKTLPMPEVEKRLGSSPKGLSQAEAEKRLTQIWP